MKFEQEVEIEIDGEKIIVDVIPSNPLMLLTPTYKRINELAGKEEQTLDEQIELAQLSERYYKSLIEKRVITDDETLDKIIGYIETYGSFMVAYQMINEEFEEAKKNSLGK